MRKYFTAAALCALMVIGPAGHIVRAENATAANPADSLESVKIRNLTATLRVNDDQSNFDELKKIGGAFATTYRVSKTFSLTYEYPNKARFEGRALGAAIVLIYNGPTKVLHSPIHSSTSNVANQPGQKQSLMDLGIFARDYLTTDYAPVFLRKEGNLDVFQLNQRNTDNRSHEIVWVNPKTSITERRVSYNGDGKLTKELRYVKPQQIRPGIFVPTQIEIYNQFGKLGVVQDVQDIKVNLGVDEAQFDVS
jgi:outer membrane lipoprotein-sorting protein